VRRGNDFFLVSVHVLSSATTKFTTAFQQHIHALVSSNLVSFCLEHKATNVFFRGVCMVSCGSFATQISPLSEPLLAIISSFVKCMQPAEAAGVASQ